MARLPLPGGDKGTWGDVLNTFLEQSHNPDGTLKPIAQSQVVGLQTTLSSKADASTLATVATSGSYGDLLDQPAIPTQASDIGAATPAQVDSKIAVQAATDLTTFLTYVGTLAAPISDPATARPSVPGIVYWVCAAGVTPSNAVNGDLVWNA